MKQIKINLPDEMIREIKIAARANGNSFAAEVRERLRAFREGHRLVKITRWMPKDDIPSDDRARAPA